MAVYEVKSPEGKTTLVECRTSKAAINHVASKGFTTTTLKMGDVVKRVKAGEQIESIEEAAASSAEETTKANDAPAGEASEEKTVGSFAGRFQKKSA